MCVHYLYSTYSDVFPSWWWNNWQKSLEDSNLSLTPPKILGCLRTHSCCPTFSWEFRVCLWSTGTQTGGAEHLWYVSCMDLIKHRCFSVFFGISWSSFPWTNLVRSKFTSNQNFPSTNLLCVAVFLPYIPEHVKVKLSLPCFKPILFQAC